LRSSSCTAGAAFLFGAFGGPGTAVFGSHIHATVTIGYLVSFALLLTGPGAYSLAAVLPEPL